MHPWSLPSLHVNLGCVLSPCEQLSQICNILMTRMSFDAGAQMEAMFITPSGATADNSIGILPQLPVPVNYPQYNSLALLPLEPSNNYSASVSSLSIADWSCDAVNLPIIELMHQPVHQATYRHCMSFDIGVSSLVHQPCKPTNSHHCGDQSTISTSHTALMHCTPAKRKSRKQRVSHQLTRGLMTHRS